MEKFEKFFNLFDSIVENLIQSFTILVESYGTTELSKVYYSYSSDERNEINRELEYKGFEVFVEKDGDVESVTFTWE